VPLQNTPRSSSGRTKNFPKTKNLSQPRKSSKKNQLKKENQKTKISKNKPKSKTIKLSFSFHKKNYFYLSTF
jgi:hypothetical protein